MAYLTDKQIEDMKNYNTNTYGAKRGAGKGVQNPAPLSLSNDC